MFSLFGNGLILGRSRALWVAALGALANLGVLLGVWTLTDLQLAGVNLAIVAITGLVANADDPRTVPTLALTTSAKPNAGMSITPMGSQPSAASDAGASSPSSGTDATAGADSPPAG